jgi:serine protease Do
VRYIALVIFSLLFFQTGWASTENEIEFYSRMAPSVVKIEAHNTNGRVSVGSGVMIAEGIAATNCHVTRDAQSVEVIKGGLSVTAEGQISDLEHDVCILKAPGMKTLVVNKANGKLRVGQEVVAFGYIAGLGPRMSAGEVTSLYEYNGSRVIESTAAFTSGASGGGLFDRNGNLLGLVTFFRRGKDDASHFSVPVDWIFQNLQKLPAKPIAPLKDGEPFWQKSAANQPNFLRAVSLRADGQAESLRSLSQSWTEAESNNSDAWFMLGNAHQLLGQYEDAIRAFRKAVAKDAEHGSAWLALGVSYVRGRIKGETEAIMRVLKSLDNKLAEKFLAVKTENCFELGEDVKC